MRSPGLGRLLLALVAPALLAAIASVTAGCGTPAQAETLASPAATAAQSPTLQVAGRLLVVRKDGTAWKLVSITPASGAEETLGTLPFRPAAALASPDRSKVLYVGMRRALAVVELPAGTLRRIPVKDYPFRAIDGATWVSNSSFVFGGGPNSYWPQGSLLYRGNVTTGAVRPFRGLKGGEPSFALQAGSLTYVTSQKLTKTPYPYRAGTGPWVKETIWRLRSLDATRPRPLVSDAEYIDAGRIYNQPLVSPDGRYILSAQTGTDVSVTYSLLRIDYFASAFLQSTGGSPTAGAWGGDKVAFQQSQTGVNGGGLAVFVYDIKTGSLAQYPCPGFIQLDWSPDGDLAGGAWQDDGEIYASSAADLGVWVDLRAGQVPVWVQ